MLKSNQYLNFTYCLIFFFHNLTKSVFKQGQHIACGSYVFMFLLLYNFLLLFFFPMLNLLVKEARPQQNVFERS